MTDNTHGQVPEALIYAELPDLDDTLWLAIGQHRRAITIVETSAAAKAVDAAVHSLLRAYADATHALRAQQPAPATQQAGEVRRAELVPGVMHCAKCKFQLNRVTLCVSDGNAYSGHNKTEPCPNGCGPLWPVTWEQEAKNCWKALEEMHERLMAAAAPQPSPTAQAASSAVLKAIREANMQLVRTGDNAFMLVPYKVATAQAAESVPAGPKRKDMLWSTAKMQERHDQRIENIVSGLERIKQEHAGQKPQKIDECYGDCPTDPTTCTNPCRFDGRAARAPADVLEDAARLDWLALAGPVSICVVIDRPHDGEVEVATDDVTGYGKTLREALDAARKQGGAA